MCFNVNNMKKVFILIMIAFTAVSCKNSQPQEKSEEKSKLQTVDLHKPFEELYKSIDPNDLKYNVYQLLNQDWSVITAGGDNDYNSMIASWGGFGVIFNKNVAWQFLNSSRYTLAKMREYKTYTLSFIDTTYNKQKLILGTKSGKDTDKMKEIQLTAVKTPAGNYAYKEAYLIIELTLEGIQELDPNCFNDEKDKQFLREAKEKNGTGYHQFITGVVTNIWVRK